jgi:hypothetical protein
MNHQPNVVLCRQRSLPRESNRPHGACRGAARGRLRRDCIPTRGRPRLTNATATIRSPRARGTRDRAVALAFVPIEALDLRHPSPVTCLRSARSRTGHAGGPDARAADAARSGCRAERPHPAASGLAIWLATGRSRPWSPAGAGLQVMFPGGQLVQRGPNAYHCCAVARECLAHAERAVVGSCVAPLAGEESRV